MKSIMQDKKECYKTHRTDVVLDKHHIFGAANRKLSEKYGLWVYLDAKLHTGDTGLHIGKNQELMEELHQRGQIAFEEHWGTREDFMRIFGRNYLDDEIVARLSKKMTLAEAGIRNKKRRI